MVSNNTKSDLTISKYDIERLEPIFGIETLNNLLLRLKVNKYELKEIEIVKDRTITESYDFGYTYF